MEPQEDLSVLAAERETARDAALPTPTDIMPRPTRRGPGIWWLLLILVIVFGYLTTPRREALGKFAQQIADIVRDFRGYEPEF